MNAFLFKTFRLETDEYLNFSDYSRVGGISATAWNGGWNTHSGDPLDLRTSYLYYRVHQSESPQAFIDSESGTSSCYREVRFDGLFTLGDNSPITGLTIYCAYIPALSD